MKMLKKMKNKKGFTLIELIVVIAVIAILAAILLPRFLGFANSAKEKATLSDARNYSVAVQALVAEGDQDITKADVEKYMGKTTDYALPGTLTIINATNGSFNYDGGNGYKAVYSGASGKIVVSTTP